jgi:hypothetical protein
LDGIYVDPGRTIQGATGKRYGVDYLAGSHIRDGRTSGGAGVQYLLISCASGFFRRGCATTRTEWRVLSGDRKRVARRMVPAGGNGTTGPCVDLVMPVWRVPSQQTGLP